MKTRYLTLFLTAAGAVFAVGGCGSSTLDPTVAARLRNDLPTACTAEQVKACPALNVNSCPNGQEAVIDYSSDCCPHFTCQPVCQSANQATCPKTPAIRRAAERDADHPARNSPSPAPRCRYSRQAAVQRG